MSNSVPRDSIPQTRILVTHGITYLPQCTQIVVMIGGKISEVGSYAALIDAEGAFAEFIRQYSGVGEEEGEGSEDDGPSESLPLSHCCGWGVVNYTCMDSGKMSIHHKTW